MTRTTRQPQAPPVPEADVLAACMKFLELMGANPRRRNVGGMFNAQGQYVAFNEPAAADIQAAVPVSARRLEVETKRTDYAPRGKKDRKHFADQIRWLNEVNAAGGIGIIVDRLEYLQRLWPWVLLGAWFHVAEDGTMEVHVDDMKGGA